jgi:transcription elongation factor GreA
MSANTIPITKRGAELLKEELQRLKHTDRPAVINAISEARAQGDLSENAEYDAAKEKQGFIEGRIKELETKLSGAQIIDPALLEAEGRVVFGATVDLEDLNDGHEQDITHVRAKDLGCDIAKDGARYGQNR